MMDFIKAVCRNRCEIVADWIRQGIDVNTFGVEDGITALHQAVRCDHLAMVELLLLAGADPWAETDESLTAFDLARLHQHESILKRLQQFKAGMNKI